MSNLLKKLFCKRERIKYFSEIIALTTILLILSPSFSILSPFIGFYFPNEKLALLILLGRLVFLKEKLFFSIKQYLQWYIPPVILLLVVTLRVIIYKDNLYITDINLVYIMLALPIYFNFFISFEKYVFRVMHYVAIIQLIIACFQWYMMAIGEYETAMIFNNYPAQEHYLYLSIGGGFFRVGGLFYESSHFAMFLSYYYIFYQQYNKGQEEKPLVSTLCLIMLLLSFSIAGYMIIIPYFIINFKKKLKVIFFAFGLIGLSLLIFIWKNMEILMSLFVYISFRLSGINLFSLNTNNIQDPRLLVVTKYLNLFFDRPFLGYGSSWETPDRWDYLSYYLYGYGILGILMVSFYIFTIVKDSKLDFYCWLVPSLAVSAAIMIPIYIVFFSSLIVLAQRHKTKKINLKIIKLN